MTAGFGPEFGIIDELVSLVGADGRRRLPRPVTIVQYKGPPRSGKADLLRELQGRYADWTPVAVYDFADTKSGTRNDQILNLLCFLLSEPRREFGQLAFPRLLSVLLAMRQAEGRPNDRAAAVRDIQRTLEDDRSVQWVQQAVEALADDATNLLPSLPGRQPPGRETARALAPDMVLTALRHSRRGWALLSPQARNGLGPWPGMITDPQRRDIDPMEAVKHTLASLSVYTGSGQMYMQSEAERQPWGAFLQDIRSGYPRKGRNLGTILVLRNVDLPAGRDFIRALADECQQREDQNEDRVPLLVLATGRQPVDDDLPALEVKRRQPPALSAADVRDLGQHSQTPGISAAQEAIPALSGGHRGIAQDMLKYCAPPRTAYPYALTPGVSLRSDLLPGESDAAFAALVSCAPAIDVGQVERAILTEEATKGPGGPAPGSELRRTLDELGWLHGAEIHPGLRILLLRHLARRPGTHEWSWAKACRRLRAEPPDQMRLTDESRSPRRSVALGSATTRALANQAYYDLAAGDVVAAVEALESIGTDHPEFTAAFDWVVTAPQPHSVSQEPRQLARRLAGDAVEAAAASGLRARLTRLIVPCWLASDRQLDPWHELDQDIAHQYREVRPLGGDLFAARARRYDDEAARWRRSERDKHPRPEGDKVP